MSVKLDGIDLNSSIEVNSDEGSDKFPCDSCDVGGVSNGRSRVFGEANDYAVHSGLVNGELRAEKDCAIKDGSLKVEIKGVNGDWGFNEGDSEDKEGVMGHETCKIDGNSEVEVPNVGNCEVGANVGKDQNQGLGVVGFPGYARDDINLLVELNGGHMADEDVISDNMFDKKGIALKEGLAESNLPSIKSAENSASIKEADVNKNKNFPIKDQINDKQLLLVDKKGAKHVPLIPEIRERECQTEKEGELFLYDLVWAKVRSHPWWPGQIFEPSAASDKAMKYFKKDSYLIAYFGDQTFAWNEASKIKPFRMNFSQMEKQSDMEAFRCAVDGALDEVSRRVETGLACRCLREEEFAKVKSQLVVNPGIREQSSKMDGGDIFSTATSFIPAKLVNYLQSLAEAPSVGINRLEFATSRAQLLAFNRWKGNYQLAVVIESNGILEDDAELSVLEQDIISDEAVDGVSVANQDDDHVEGKANLLTQDGSRKRKHQTTVNRCKKKNESLSELIFGSSSSLLNGEKQLEKQKSRKTASSSFTEDRKADDAVSGESIVKRRKKISLQTGRNETLVNYTKAGEKMRKVAGKLTRSQTADTSGFGVSISTGIGHEGRMTPNECLSTDDMLSKLVVTAENPMDGSVILTSVFSFFLEFRNYICLERNHACNEKKSSRRRNSDEPPELENKELKFEGTEDSYWTDRIIQSCMDDKVLFEPNTRDVMDIIAAEGIDGMGVSTHINREVNAMATKNETENASQRVDEESEYSPTALILNFSDLKSVPSIANLNTIFNRYGPLNESETEVFSKSKRAKLVFEKRSDAETAFSSTGKFSLFGPSLVSYRLKYLPKLQKAPSGSQTKRRRKDTKSTEDIAL